MKKLAAHILFILFLTHLSGQEVTLSRQVIGSSGATFQNNELLISFTTGEVIIGTSETDQYVYTQGFHQPSDKSLNPITYDISVKKETCPDKKDGAILLSNFEGCEKGNYTIEWENGQSGSQIQNLNSGWYSIELLACGRSISDSVEVGLIYESTCLLVFYTAFSPNGDGKNDVWEVDNIDAEVNQLNEVKIVNRWGDEIRSFRNYDNLGEVWDGKNADGKEVTEGTYYYFVSIQGKEYTGYIELTR